MLFCSLKENLHAVFCPNKQRSSEPFMPLWIRVPNKGDLKLFLRPAVRGGTLRLEGSEREEMHRKNQCPAWHSWRLRSPVTVRKHFMAAHHSGRGDRADRLSDGAWARRCCLHCCFGNEAYDKADPQTRVACVVGSQTWLNCYEVVNSATASLLPPFLS